MQGEFYKFIQITAVTTEPNLENGFNEVLLFALDARGDVWFFDFKSLEWRPASMKRATT